MTKGSDTNVENLSDKQLQTAVEQTDNLPNSDSTAAKEVLREAGPQANPVLQMITLPVRKPSTTTVESSDAVTTEPSDASVTSKPTKIAAKEKILDPKTDPIGEDSTLGIKSTESTAQLANGQADEQPTFADLGLNSEILKALDAAGYKQPTPIQTQAIPVAIQGKNVVGLAQTGTGKTASFTLPMLHNLASGRARARMPRSLILSPTRELATQTSENFEKYGQNLKLSMALLIGGVSMGDQERALEKGVDVLIATPGRLIDWFERGKILLGGLECLVIDEADRMLDMGFMPDVERILALVVRRKQTMLFSATMPKEVRRLADKFLSDPIEIRVEAAVQDHSLVTERLIECTPATKSKLLKRLIQDHDVVKAIIFCNRKKDISGITSAMQRSGFNAKELHGDMEQSSRLATLEAFKNDQIDYLIATDVAARGLDISDMPVVINLDVPMNAEDYVHRIGRTGRAGKQGRAFTFASKADERFLKSIETIRGGAINALKLKNVKHSTDGNLEDIEHGRPTDTKRKNRRLEKTIANERHELKDNKKRNCQPANKRTRRNSEEPVIGLGDHTPAFLLRRIPIGEQRKES